MKKIKPVVSALALVLIVVAVIVLVRTITASPPQAVTILDVKIPPFNEKKMISQFAKLLTFQTISSDAGNIQQAEFDKMQVFLRQTYPAFFSTMTLTNIGQRALLLKWQGKNSSLKPVLMMAHQDVVPVAPGTENDWYQQPFGGAIVDGYVWGRGALDTKETLSSIIAATSLLIEQHFRPERTIYFYFGDDEESGGKSALLASEYLQKHNIHFEYVIDEGGAIIRGQLPGVANPVALIGVAEKGYLNLQLKAQSEGGHSSIPGAHTAIGDLSLGITNVLRKPFSRHINEVVRQLLNTVAFEMPLMQRMVARNVWLFEPVLIRKLGQAPKLNAFLQTTQAPTIINGGTKANVLPVYATATMNFRIAPGDSLNGVITHVERALRLPNIKVTMLKGWEPSPVSSTDSAGYQLLRNAVATLFGKQIITAPTITTGATDSRRFVNIADNIYRFSPVIVNESDMKRLHGTNERLATDAYLNLISFYYTVISQE